MIGAHAAWCRELEHVGAPRLSPDAPGMPKCIEVSASLAEELRTHICPRPDRFCLKFGGHVEALCGGVNLGEVCRCAHVRLLFHGRVPWGGAEHVL